jgi:hypothetical protein
LTDMNWAFSRGSCIKLLRGFGLRCGGGDLLLEVFGGERISAVCAVDEVNVMAAMVADHAGHQSCLREVEAEEDGAILVKVRKEHSKGFGLSV